jgi:hypothetical protein
MTGAALERDRDEQGRDRISMRSSNAELRPIGIGIVAGV